MCLVCDATKFLLLISRLTGCRPSLNVLKITEAFKKEAVINYAEKKLVVSVPGRVTRTIKSRRMMRWVGQIAGTWGE